MTVPAAGAKSAGAVPGPFALIGVNRAEAWARRVAESRRKRQPEQSPLVVAWIERNRLFQVTDVEKRRRLEDAIVNDVDLAGLIDDKQIAGVARHRGGIDGGHQP